jgi:hypothetical protein
MFARFPVWETGVHHYQAEGLPGGETVIDLSEVETEVDLEVRLHFPEREAEFDLSVGGTGIDPEIQLSPRSLLGPGGLERLCWRLVPS